MSKTPIQTDENGFRKFGILDKLSYAAGDLGCNMSFALKSSIMAIFWTQFMALGDELYATLLVIVQVWDAINDPLMGSIIDRTRTRYGKLRPYLLIVPIPLGLATIMLFAGPALLGDKTEDVAKIIYMFIYK